MILKIKRIDVSVENVDILSYKRSREEIVNVYFAF